MKKCPYCAEEIQDEAIVCRYCGRDLPSLPGDKVTPKKDIKPPVKPSAWKTGAIVSAVLTFLYFINNAFLKAPEGDRFQGNLIFGLLSTFLFWWLVATAIIFIWRKLGAGITVAIIAFVGFLIFTLVLVFNVVANISIISSTTTPTFSPRPTITPRSTITPTQTSSVTRFIATFDAAATKVQSMIPPPNCILWNQVNESFVGQTICVYGIVYEAKSLSNGLFQIYFNKDGYFFTLLDNHNYPDLKTGDCVIAYGEVKRSGAFPYINLNGNLNICVP